MNAATLHRALPRPVVRALRHAVPPRARMRFSPMPPWRVSVWTGTSPIELPLQLDRAQPVFDEDELAAHRLRAIADPFAVHRDGLWHLFVEAIGVDDLRGRIGLATSADLEHWRYRGIVLAEPFHLSYPLVFEAGGEMVMIPESSADGTVRLYRADPFPTRWRFDRILLTGAPFKDATVFAHEGRWWLLAETSRRHTNDQLRLWWADRIEGPWEEHAASPLIDGDPALARPAGRPLVLDGRLLRLAQDCSASYGARVLGVELIELSGARVDQRLPAIEVAAPTHRDAWARGGIHHLDLHRLTSASHDGTTSSTAIQPDWVGFLDGRPALGHTVS